MSESVASNSTFTSMYMRNHPDTLVAYVKHFGKVSGNVSSADMKSIDYEGMNLSYSLKSGGVGSVRIKFDPPLADNNEVKPRLISMKVKAQEALGMLKSPMLTSFRLPSRAVKSLLYFLIGTAYFSLAPPEGTSLPFIPVNITDMVFMPARTITSAVGFRPSMRRIVQLTAAIHGIESLYTWYLCGHHVKGTFVTAAYLVATFVFGFPIWVDLRKRVQDMRIDSVMKAE